MKKIIKVENMHEYYNLLEYDKEVCNIVGKELFMPGIFPRLLVIKDDTFKFFTYSFYLIEEYKSEGYQYVDSKIYLRKDKLSRINF